MQKLSKIVFVLALVISSLSTSVLAEEFDPIADLYSDSGLNLPADADLAEVNPVMDFELSTDVTSIPVILNDYAVGNGEVIEDLPAENIPSHSYSESSTMELSATGPAATLLISSFLAFALAYFFRKFLYV